MKMMDYNFSETAAELMQHDNILLVTHKNPDGDTLGSASGLCSILKRVGKNAWMYRNPQITPKFMAYVQSFLAPEDFSPDFIVSVDVADTDMFAEGFEGFPALCIDHHGTNPHFSEKNCIFPERSSCAEGILEISSGIVSSLTEEEATLLYIGLSTDNGCFLYSNTNSASHLAAASLISYHADICKVNEQFFREVSRQRIALENMIFSGLEFYYDGAVIVSTITLEMLEKSGAEEDDLDNIASLPDKIAGRKIAVTIREKENGISKISIRTAKDGFSASEISSFFGGGGHLQAAGCTIYEKPDRAKELLLESIDRIWKKQ